MSTPRELTTEQKASLLEMLDEHEVMRADLLAGRIEAMLAFVEGGENQPHLDTSGQSEWLICTDCHFVCYGDGPCHCTMEGKPGNRILVVLSPDRWLQTDAVVAQGDAA